MRIDAKAEQCFFPVYRQIVQARGQDSAELISSGDDYLNVIEDQVPYCPLLV